MIMPLRKRHRFMITLLAIVLPIAFITGLTGRQAPAVMEIPPVDLQASAAVFSQIVYEKNDLWPGHTITTRLCADGMPPTRLTVELQPREDFKIPDLLVYWHEGEMVEGDRIPAGAFLLGNLAGRQARQMILPEGALQYDGRLVLFSLAHQKIFASAALPTRTIP